MKKLYCLLSLLALTLAAGTFEKQFLGENNASANTTSVPGTISTKLNYIDSSLSDIVWCGEKRNVIFFLTEKSTLYRSVDEGFSGHVLTEHLQQIGKKELTGTSHDAGQVARIIQSPVDKSILLFQGTKRVNWITEDCGISFRAMDQGRKVDDFKFHPTDRNWLLASAWTLPEDFKGQQPRKYRELFVSKDLGNNWDLLGKYIFQFAWGQVDASFQTIPKERIVVAYESNAKGDQKTTGGWSESLEIVFSDDFFHTISPMVRGGNKFLISNNFLFVVQASQEDNQEVTLLVGDPRDKYYMLRPIEIPVKRLMEHSYTILDTAEQSVFLHINHDGDQSTYGNIYVSDSTGVRYSLALKKHVRNRDGQCDFERVQGVEGIYLANVYDREATKRFRTVDHNEFPQQHAGAKKTSEIASNNGDMYSALYHEESGQVSAEDYKVTMISFDKGAMWQQLTPPTHNSHGKRITCQDCSLHLHSISNTNFGPFYTTKNSLGLILGTGNVGTYLSNRPDEINTYLSRDGGLTWFEIAKGSHTYEIGDHGSILVLAPNQEATSEVLYSWNEGLTWSYLNISDTPIEVKNIIIEPSNTGERFIIYGRTKDSTQKGAIIAIDFTPLHQRWCKGQDTPDTVDSDYETWVPNGKISPHCLMGRQVSYTRRKREAECFNSEEHEQWKMIKQCECTEEDWECDLGYTRVGSGPCLPINDALANLSRVPPEQCNAYYYLTQGYRKIAGDICTGGVDHSPLTVTCPGTSSLNSKNFMVLLSFISIVLGLVWLSNKGNSEIVKGGLDSFTQRVRSMIPKKEKKEEVGFHGIGEIPDTLRDEDNFGGMAWEESEDQAEPIEDEKLQEFAQGKRMTERKAMEAANKRVPTLNRPADKKAANYSLYGI